MKNEEFARKAMEYYPVGENPSQIAYMDSKEFLALKERVSTTPAFWPIFLDKMTRIPSLFTMDSTTLSMETPALLCDIYKHTKRYNYKLTFHFSALIPYYYFEILRYEVGPQIQPTDDELKFFLRLFSLNQQTLLNQRPPKIPYSLFQRDEYLIRQMSENIRSNGHQFYMSVEEFEENSYVKKMMERIRTCPRERFLNLYPSELEDSISLIHLTQQESIGYQEFPAALLSERLNEIRTPSNPNSPNTYKEIFWGNS